MSELTELIVAATRWLKADARLKESSVPPCPKESKKTATLFEYFMRANPLVDEMLAATVAKTDPIPPPPAAPDPFAEAENAKMNYEVEA